MQTPVVYVDEDWAGDCKTRWSISGCDVMMGGAAVSPYARQKVVALLSTKAECLSLPSGMKETVQIRRLLQGLVFVANSSHVTTVLIGNQGGKTLSLNLSTSRRSK